MTLPEIRRLLIVIVVVLLVIDGGLIAYAKFGSSFSSAARQQYSVVAFCMTTEPITKLKGEAQKLELDVETAGVKHEFPVPEGYRLVMRNDPEVLVPIHETAKFKKLPVKLTDKNACLQYGKIEKDKKKADKLAKQVTEKHSLTFTVEPSMKHVSKNGYKILLKSVPGTAIEDIRAVVEGDESFVDVKIAEIKESSES